MSIFANASLQSLKQLKDGLSLSKSQFHQIYEEIEKEIENYFNLFHKKQEILHDRLNKAENALASAENELYEMERRKHWVEDEDGSGHWTPDTSAQEAKVRECRRHRDRCHSNLTECRSIIERCSHSRKFINGSYNVIDRSFSTTLNDLQTDLNNVLNYQGRLQYSDNLNRSPQSVSIEKPIESQKPQFKEKIIRQRFFDKEGNALVNAKITIVDHQIFGFPDQYLTTDDDGFVTMPYVFTENCSIYLEGEEIYKGKLFENMEYNRYEDGKMVTNLTNNNESETESRGFDNIGHNIDVTHSINIDEEYPNNIRREEIFTRNNENGELEKIEISLTSDDHKSEVKDGWIKIIKEEEDKND